MPINEYNFLDEVGLQTLSTEIMSKLNTRVMQMLSTELNHLPTYAVENSLNKIFNENTVDNRLIPIGVPDTIPEITDSIALSTVSLTITMTYNDIVVPGTISWVTTDDEFANSIHFLDKSVITVSAKWEFIPTDIITYQSVIGEVGIIVNAV